MRRSTVIAVLIPAAIGLTVAGCGSSAGSGGSAGSAAQVSASPTGSSNANLTSAQINDGITTAIKDVTALHLKGTMDEGGQAMSVDIQVNEGSGGGTIGEGGVTVPIRQVHGVSYLQMTPEVIKGLVDPKITSSTGRAAAQLLSGKWISSNSAAGKGMTQDFSELLDLQTVTTNLVKGPNDAFTYIGTATVDGQQVAQYKDVPSDKTSPTSTASFPLYGPTLPIELDAGSHGMITLVWNKSVPVTAPPADQIVTLPSS